MGRLVPWLFGLCGIAAAACGASDGAAVCGPCAPGFACQDGACVWDRPTTPVPLGELGRYTKVALLADGRLAVATWDRTHTALVVLFVDSALGPRVAAVYTKPVDEKSYAAAKLPCQGVRSESSLRR